MIAYTPSVEFARVSISSVLKHTVVDIVASKAQFMLSVISQTLAQNAPVNAPVNVPVNVPLNVLTQIEGRKTPEAILLLLETNHALTRAQLADALSKDIRTIGRALAKLQQAGKVKRIGSDKAGHWEVHL